MGLKCRYECFCSFKLFNFISGFFESKKRRYFPHFSSDLAFKGIVVNRANCHLWLEGLFRLKNEDRNYFQKKMRKVVLLLCVLLPIIVISNPRHRRQVKWLLKKTWKNVCFVKTSILLCPSKFERFMWYRVTHKGWNFRDDCTNFSNKFRALCYMKSLSVTTFNPIVNFCFGTKPKKLVYKVIK